METRIGFGRRLGAYVIDIVFVFGIAFILGSLFGEFFERFIDWSEITDEQIAQTEMVFKGFANFIFTLGATATIAAFVYNLLEGFTGYTLGKLMLGIQIANQDGTKAEQGKLMLRFAIKNISTIVGLIGIAIMVSMVNNIGSVLGFIIFIGCFFAIGEKKLALHDMLAKTAVYRKKELEDGSAADTILDDFANKEIE